MSNDRPSTGCTDTTSNSSGPIVATDTWPPPSTPRSVSTLVPTVVAAAIERTEAANSRASSAVNATSPRRGGPADPGGGGVEATRRTSSPVAVAYGSGASSRA